MNTKSECLPLAAGGRGVLDWRDLDRLLRLTTPQQIVLYLWLHPEGCTARELAAIMVCPLASVISALTTLQHRHQVRGERTTLRRGTGPSPKRYRMAETA